MKIIFPYPVNNNGEALQVGWKAFTRDMTANDEDVAYTGLGFKPKAILLYCVVNGTNIISWGVATDIQAQSCNYFDISDTYWWYDTMLGILSNADAYIQTAYLKTFDSDGFTITWNKITGFTGTAKCAALCIG